MKRIAVVASAVLVMLGVGMARAEDGQTVKKQTVCPVMGGEVNSHIYADADGKRVYFCCKSCQAEFKKDPAKYIAKLEKDGVTLDKAPEAAQPKKQKADCAAVPAKGCDSSAMKEGGCCK